MTNQDDTIKHQQTECDCVDCLEAAQWHQEALQSAWDALQAVPSYVETQAAIFAAEGQGDDKK